MPDNTSKTSTDENPPVKTDPVASSEDGSPITAKPLTLWQIVVSTLGAALGVQSDNVRQRDFQQRSPLPYIISGIVFTVIFVVTLFIVVGMIV